MLNSSFFPSLFQWVLIGAFIWALQSADVDIAGLVSGILGGIGALLSAVLNDGIDALLSPLSDGAAAPAQPGA